MAFMQYKNQWWEPSGITPTSHIFKLPMGIIHAKGGDIDLSESIENEWLCLKILEAFNLPVNEAEMHDFDDVKALVVKRFDCQWDRKGKWLLRVPQEDMCQVLGYSPGLKYEPDGGPGIMQIMKVLNGSINSIDDRRRFMKTVFLFWVLAAPDGHAKNFSVFIEPGGRYKLTPIYDVISAYPLMSKREVDENKIKMAMGVHGKNKHYKWHEIQLRHWFDTAEKCSFPKEELQGIIDDTCDKVDDVIHKVSKMLPDDFPTHISESIFSGMKKIKNKIQIF